jgi:hypothetical protein
MQPTNSLASGFGEAKSVGLGRLVAVLMNHLIPHLIPHEYHKK